MAIWHFKFSLIPAKAVERRFELLPITVPQTEDEAGYDWWQDAQPPREFTSWLSEIAPLTPSWGWPERKMWGVEHENEIDVIYNEKDLNRVEWIGCKIDVRELSIPLITNLVNFAKRLDCLFLLNADGRVLIPDVSSLLKAIGDSTAQKYLDDPTSTLKSLKQEDAKIIQFEGAKRKEKE